MTHNVCAKIKRNIISSQMMSEGRESRVLTKAPLF